MRISDWSSDVCSSDLPRQDTSEDSGDEIIVVTGSHIRGAAIASPVITVGRDSIDKAGQNDLGEVVRSIYQNFSGGQNPGIGTGGGLSNGNLDSSSQLNIRGLGPDAKIGRAASRERVCQSV